MNPQARALVRQYGATTQFWEDILSQVPVDVVHRVWAEEREGGGMFTNSALCGRHSGPSESEIEAAKLAHPASHVRIALAFLVPGQRDPDTVGAQYVLRTWEAGGFSVLDRIVLDPLVDLDAWFRARGAYSAHGELAEHYGKLSCWIERPHPNRRTCWHTIIYEVSQLHELA